MYLNCEITATNTNRQCVSAKIMTTCRIAKDMQIANKVADGLPMYLLRKQGVPAYKRLGGKRTPTSRFEINDEIEPTQFMGDRPFQGQASTAPKICHIARMVLGSVRPDQQFYKIWAPAVGLSKLPAETTVEQIGDYVSFELIEEGDSTKGYSTVLQYKCRDVRLRERLLQHLHVHHANELYLVRKQKFERQHEQKQERIAQLRSQIGPETFIKDHLSKHRDQLQRQLKEQEKAAWDARIETGPVLKKLQDARARWEEVLGSSIRGNTNGDRRSTPTQRKTPPGLHRQVPMTAQSTARFLTTSSSDYSTSSPGSINVTPESSPAPPSRTRSSGHINTYSQTGQWQPNHPNTSQGKFQMYDFVRFVNNPSKWGRILPPKRNKHGYRQQHGPPGTYEVLLGESAKVVFGIREEHIELFSDEDRAHQMIHCHSELVRDIERVRNGQLADPEDYFKYHRYDMERLAFLGGVVDKFAAGKVVKFSNVIIPCWRISDADGSTDCIPPINPDTVTNYHPGFPYSDHLHPCNWAQLGSDWKQFYRSVVLELAKNGFPAGPCKNGGVRTSNGDRPMIFDLTVVSGQIESRPCVRWGQRNCYRLVIRVRLPADHATAFKRYQKANNGSVPYYLFGNFFNDCRVGDWENGRIEKFQQQQKAAQKFWGANRTGQLPKDYSEVWGNTPENVDLLAVFLEKKQPVPAPKPQVSYGIPAQVPVHQQGGPAPFTIAVQAAPTARHQAYQMPMQPINAANLWGRSMMTVPPPQYYNAPHQGFVNAVPSQPTSPMPTHPPMLLSPPYGNTLAPPTIITSRTPSPLTIEQSPASRQSSGAFGWLTPQSQTPTTNWLTYDMVDHSRPIITAGAPIYPSPANGVIVNGAQGSLFQQADPNMQVHYDSNKRVSDARSVQLTPRAVQTTPRAMMQQRLSDPAFAGSDQCHLSTPPSATRTKSHEHVAHAPTLKRTTSAPMKWSPSKGKIDAATEDDPESPVDLPALKKAISGFANKSPTTSPAGSDRGSPNGSQCGDVAEKRGSFDDGFGKKQLATETTFDGSDCSIELDGVLQ